MWRWEFWVGALLCTASCALGSLESPELAWLLANESPPLAARRITPKSVFLAPTFTSCAEGYRQDALGRCVKIVKLNQAAQWDFFLQKLNSMYAPPVREKPSSGPFRLPIPLGEPETTTMGSTTTSTDSTTTTDSDEEEGKTSTLIPSTSTQGGEDGTETPLLIIVANTTEPTTTDINTGRTDIGSTSRTEMSTSRTDPYTSSTEQFNTNPTENVDCRDCGQQQMTTTTETFGRRTTQPPSMPPQLSTRWAPVRFPSERPTYIRFPSNQETTPYWWPQSWEQSVWPPQRTRGHREPRPSWIHQ